MTEPKKPAQRKKQPDADKIAEAELRKEALKAAKDAGIQVDETWTSERIEDAVAKAKAAEEAAAKAPKPEPKPAAEVNEEDPIRKEILAEAESAGMNLADLEGVENDEVLALIGQHVGAQALKKEDAVEQKGHVSMRVLKAGDGKISKGVHVPGVGDLKYKQGDVIDGAKAHLAAQLEDRGFVEILDA